MLLKLAWRNIFRNRTRTRLTVGMMVFGYVLFSFFLALGDGVYDSIIEQFIDANTGEAQVHYKDYLSEPRVYKSIPNYNQIISILILNKNIQSASPRIKGNALGFYQKKTFGVSIVGVDFEKELATTTLGNRVTEGVIPTLKNEIIIGGKVAKILKLSVGDTLVLISSGADGSIANDKFIVTAVINPAEGGADDHKVYMTLSMAQDFYSLGGRVHEIMLRTKGKSSLAKASIRLPPHLTLSSWQQVESDFYRAMQADKKGDAIGRFIIIFLVALGVLNTVLMSILDRTREFGVLKAIGTRPTFLAKLIIVETLLLGLLGTLIGFVISLALNIYFSKNGIVLETAIEYGGFRFEEMKATTKLMVFLSPAFVIIVTSFFVSLIPAFRASKIVPVEAMRS
ncbi:MAG: ABC transporter permease [Halobacteriovoraceae bacterium]|jgi:putative ABC transport system permease protein|nr:ABC transporter permease [Halobacteriovoraceae bacterium]